MLVAGGPSALESGFIRTVACRTCSPVRLVDARKRTEPFEQSEQTADYICPGELTEPRPSRRRRHEIESWDAGSACPRCGGVMVADPMRVICAD